MKFMKRMFAISALLFTVGSAHALDKEAYSQERFETLQAAGEVILIDVHAPWCSTCKKQQRALEQYRSANSDKQFTILEVDFDKDKDLVRQFRAPRQSTLVLYKGKEQVWFSVAETRFAAISAELDSALSVKPAP